MNHRKALKDAPVPSLVELRDPDASGVKEVGETGIGGNGLSTMMVIGNKPSEEQHQ